MSREEFIEDLNLLERRAVIAEAAHERLLIEYDRLKRIEADSIKAKAEVKRLSGRRIKIAELRDIMDAVAREDISYGRAVELINNHFTI